METKLTLVLQGMEIVLWTSADVFAPTENGAFYGNAVRVNPGESTIDIGTGSGFLAIYAAKKGSVSYATDINSSAVSLAQQNARLNHVSIHCSEGSLFGPFTGPFDVITANLPNEIEPPESEGSPAGSFSKGATGNEVLLELLECAHTYMHDQTRLYLPVHSLTDYLGTFQAMLKRYNAQLVSLAELPAKDFLIRNLEFYKDLQEKGVIQLVHRGNSTYTVGYVFELTKKK